MRADIKWRGKVQFTAVADSGHMVAIDGPPDAGGENQGSRPMELMLMGVGGCTSFDVVNILQKSRQSIHECVTQVTGTRSQDIPQVFETIHIHFAIKGDNVDPAKVQRAIDLTAEKYCSASIMLQRAGVEIEHSFTIS